MKRILGSLAVLAGALAAVFWLKAAPEKPRVREGICERCNLVLVSIDNLRRDRLSLYGYHRPTTPNIDAWAAGAVVFENYFATAYLTPVSESSVHTGLYPEVNGMTSFRHPLRDDIDTLAEVLKRAGYRTAAIGNSPEFVNFETLHASFRRGFELFNKQKIRMANQRSPDWAAVKKFLAAGGRKPFFLWLTLGDAHTPFGEGARNLFADPAYRGPFTYLRTFANLQFYYDGKIYDPSDPAKAFRLFAWRGGESGAIHSVTDPKALTGPWPKKATREDLEYYSAIYDNGVAESDREFQTLLDLLGEAGAGHDTVIVLQSEHGESFGERGYLAHYDITDETVRVPLVIQSPALGGGKRVSHLASGVDVMPTMLSHLGVSARPRQEMDGSVLFAADGSAIEARTEVFLTRSPLWEAMLQAEGEDRIFDRFRALDDSIGFKDHAIRTKSAKLIHRTARLVEERFSCWRFVSGKSPRRQEFEFFDIERDPGEKNPMKPGTAVAKDMQAKLAAWKESVNKRARTTGIHPVVQDYQ